MLTFDRFTGIDNVNPEYRLNGRALKTAVNVDITRTGSIRRRAGYSFVAAGCHKNVWQADGFVLATTADDALTAIAPNGARTVVHAALGTARVWYVNLPDGRTAYSNGLANGITDGAVTTAWGVPVPSSLGGLTPMSGTLPAGDYQYALTYVRLADGREGGTAFSDPIAVSSGGFILTGLPLLTGHSINIYLSGQNGGETFFVGNALGNSFGYNGATPALALPARTQNLDPLPVGTVSCFWRGRALVAQESTLWASRSQQWELCDRSRDYKQFAAPITLLQAVDDGLYVGTEDELCFLSGTEFDKLTYTQKVKGRTVLGSGVSMRGEMLKQGDATATGSAMLCIADKVIVAGFSGGQIMRMTEGVYQTDATEVAATFRMADSVPQYVAVPQ